MTDGVAEALPSIQSLLIPQRQVPLLLPMASVVEIIGYRELSGDEKSQPAWLLGHFSWRHLSLPLISMERLLGVEREGRRGRRRIVLVHVFADDLEHPFVGIEATGMPRLVNANQETLRIQESGNWPDDWPVVSKLKVQETEALIPDLERLGQLVREIQRKSPQST